ncbi:MSHA biogenesis protein MshK [Vibrio sp. STUT-A11]|uniref:MSHA biogenesis protein MshK n=1 Tax=unclassified Vibrio TaxID=2614977 RepID=UPI00222F3208|nr:MSHA biogenesis protein MshK [Vibrio sp. STUT-A11]BDR12320.1 MSHA biogenesis protein MshK [Vibrio sp. STUT-A11]
MVKNFIISIALAVIAGGAWANQDPTAPLGWQKPVVESSTKPTKKRYRLPSLNSIVCKVGSQCSAIMDNRIVEQGELFKGYRVVSITSEFVTLKQGSRQWKLELFGLNVKK